MPIQITKSNKRVVIFDIDGCCIDSEERLPHLLAGDREMYNELHPTDKSMPAGVAVYSALLHSHDYECLFITGRQEDAREFTEQQLIELFGPLVMATQLLMRPVGDRTHDVELKPRLLKKAGFAPEDVLLVFEDRDSTVAMWRSLGVTVYQTQPGDF